MCTVIDLVICKHWKFTSSVVSTSSTSSVFAAVCLNTDHTYSGKNTADEPLWYKNLMDKAKCPYKKYVCLIKFSTM